MSINNDDNYISFCSFTFKNGVVSHGFDLFDDDPYELCMMKYNDFIDLIKTLSNSYVIDCSRIRFNIIKVNAHKTDKEYHGYELYEPNKGHDPIIYPRVSNELKDILDKSTYKIINDAYSRHSLDMMLIRAREEIEIFLNSQTSYDNIDKYKNMLEAIKSNE